MTDKERLEMIKGIQKRIKEYQEKGQNVSNLHSDYVDWLIEQAKKVERYKQALEFYADEETYETKFATDTDEIYDSFTLIELDNGEKARQALEG